jgi:predicted porin
VSRFTVSSTLVSSTVTTIGGQKLYETSSGNVQGSRWGLRGTEDLGGGLKARFVLENGFNIISDSPGAMG